MRETVHGLSPNGPSSLLASTDFDFTVTATDANGSIVRKDYTLTVTP
jgi:hypothetical protein